MCVCFCGGRLTRPSSLSSRARTPVLSVKSFTLTDGSGWVVVKSPWVPHLKNTSILMFKNIFTLKTKDNSGPTGGPTETFNGRPGLFLVNRDFQRPSGTIYGAAHPLEGLAIVLLPQVCNINLCQMVHAMCLSMHNEVPQRRDCCKGHEK